MLTAFNWKKSCVNGVQLKKIAALTALIRRNMAALTALNRKIAALTALNREEIGVNGVQPKKQRR